MNTIVNTDNTCFMPSFFLLPALSFPPLHHVYNNIPSFSFFLYILHQIPTHLIMNPVPPPLPPPLAPPLLLPAAPPLPSRLTVANETSDYLQYLHQNQSAPALIYLHPNPISFYTNKEKVDWTATYNDTAARHTYSQYTNANRGGAHQTAGLFQTWGNTWVGRPAGDWQYDEWHAWLGGTIRNPSGPGKTVLIWDSNAADMVDHKGREPIFNDLSAPQRRFVNDLRKKGPIPEAWYGGSGNNQDRICTLLAAQQLQGWMQNGLPYGQEQLAAQGYWRVR